MEPDQAFTSADAAAVAATPATYIRFPGGVLGEELNYSSGVYTSSDGTQKKLTTSTAEFVTECKSIGCHAIMQLPVEIDSPSTAAYYAKYIVNTLGYQPAYWELGNSPPGWIHFGVPWSEWKSKTTPTETPAEFATLIHTYIAAILKVDPAGKFLALGAGMGTADYAKAWIEPLVSADGSELAGISVHSYILATTPTHPTAAEFFANLGGAYSIPDQVLADRSYIKAACSTCTTGVFVSEINAAEAGSTFVPLMAGFPGTLYLAAEITQGLSLQVPNMDWFCYHCDFLGAWSIHTLVFQPQDHLFSDLATQFKTETLPTTVTGPSTFYGIATYNSGGLSLMMVNVGSSTVSANIAQTGFILDRAGVTEYSWASAAKSPSKSSVTLSSTVSVPSMSIILLTVGSAGAKSPGGPSATLGLTVVPGTSGPASGMLLTGSASKPNLAGGAAWGRMASALPVARGQPVPSILTMSRPS